MRKGFWRIAAGLCVTLMAATFGLTAAAPHADAAMLESQDGSISTTFYSYDSSAGNVWSDFDVAVGQTVQGRLSFLNKNDGWAYINSDDIDITSSDEDIAKVSYESHSWVLTISPTKVGATTITLKSKTDESLNGSLKIKSVAKVNPIKVSFVSYDQSGATTNTATLGYTDDCPQKCGNTHYALLEGRVDVRPVDESRAATYFVIKEDPSKDSKVQAKVNSNYSSYGTPELSASLQLEALAKDAKEAKVLVDYCNGETETKKLCDVVTENQEPGFNERGNKKQKMLVGDSYYLSAILNVSPNEALKACQRAHWDALVSSVTYSLESNDVVELIDGENSFKAMKLGTVKAHAHDGLGNDHPFEIEVVDPTEVNLSKAKFVSSDYTFSCEVNSHNVSKDWLWLEGAREFEYPKGVLSESAEDLIYTYAGAEYSFTSDNPDVLEVKGAVFNGGSAMGYLVPHGYGDATVSMYLGGRLCDTMTVHVVKPGEEPAKAAISIADGYLTSMDKGATQQLKAKVSPDDKASQVVWSSSNEGVLTVDANGLVTAVGDGTASITATVDGVSATTDAITVTTSVVKASGVKLSTANLKLTVGGEPSTLTAAVEPDNATNKNVSWSSSDPEVATVAGGVVTPVKAGAATITVTTEDGEHSAACKVTVIQPAAGITLDKQKVALVGAATEQLKAAVVPAEANQTVVWKSSNESVATVDQTGKVTAVSKGTATIIVSTEDGVYSQDCAVTVSNPATNLTVDQTALNLKKGEEGTVKISLVGALAGEVDETKLALDDTGASKAFKVVDNGDGSYTVTALKTGSGSFVITAESLSQTVSVTVTNPVQKVELDKTGLSFTVGDASAKLSATVSPADADDTTVSWTSSDSSIATVKDGVVTPLKAGAATITATCGDKTMTCTVAVAARTIAGVAGSDGTDVSVSAENNAAAGIAQNNSISLVVEEPTNLTDAANATISGLEQGGTKVADKLDIKLLKDGEVIEDYEGMSFIVRVKMTAAMKALTNLKVLYVAEDGSTQAMDTWTEGDYLCFRTSHFSTYVVTGEEANGEPVQPTQPVTPSQPSQQTTTKVTKKSVKATKGALANTGDRTLAVVSIATVAGVALIAFALMRKRFER